MKYYIIAGEASGDLHGSNLMKGIYAEDPQAEIRFWGGDSMLSVWDQFTDGSSNGSDIRFQNRATPLAAGGGTRSAGVGGVVLKNLPDREHAVAAPEADGCLRVFCIYAFHKVGAVEVA